MSTPGLLLSARDMCAEIDSILSELGRDEFDATEIGIRLDLLKAKFDERLTPDWDSTIEKELSQARHRLRHRVNSKATEQSHSGLFDCRISLSHLRDYLEQCERKVAL